MKTRTKMLPLLAAVGLLGLFAGCGSEQPTDKAANPTTPPAATPAPTGATEVARAPVNPDDDAAFAALAATYEIECPPFEEPERHRGAGAGGILLLWPRREVRIEGLGAFAIEVDETYEGDGFIEFRQGSKVLWRSPEAFDPKNLVSVEPMPIEVLQEGLKSGEKVTWGIFYEDKRRKPVKAEFQVVKEPKAEKQIARIKSDASLDRQDPITRDLMIAQVFENHRLYTEALVTNLAIAQAHPETSRPFKGIVTALQRLDLKESTLHAALSPHVSGKGMARATPPGGAESLAQAVGTYSLPIKVGMPAPLASVDRPAGSSGFQKRNEGLQGAPKDRPGEDTQDVGVPVQPPSGDRVKFGEELARRTEQTSKEAEEAAALAAQVQKDMEALDAEFAAAQTKAGEAEAARTTAMASHAAAVEKAGDAQERLTALQNQDPPAGADEIRAAEEALGRAKQDLERSSETVRNAEADVQASQKSLLSLAPAVEAARQKAVQAIAEATGAGMRAKESQAQLDAFKANQPPSPTDPARLEEQARTEALKKDVARLQAEFDAAKEAHKAAYDVAQAQQAALTSATESVTSLEAQVRDLEAKGDTDGMKAAYREWEAAKAKLAEVEREAKGAMETLEATRTNAQEIYRQIQQLAGPALPEMPVKK